MASTYVLDYFFGVQLLSNRFTFFFLYYQHIWYYLIVNLFIWETFMFQTDTAKDAIQKLLPINPGWRDEPYLLPKAYLSCKICSRRRIFSDQDILVLGKYLLDPFFNENPKHTHDIAYFCNVFSRCPTIGYFLNLYAPDIVVDIKALRDIRNPNFMPRDPETRKKRVFRKFVGQVVCRKSFSGDKSDS